MQQVGLVLLLIAAGLVFWKVSDKGPDAMSPSALAPSSVQSGLESPDKSPPQILRLRQMKGGYLELNLTRNSKRRPRPMAELLGFLHYYNGHKKSYVLDEHDCKHFAYELWSKLNEQEFQAHYVAIQLTGQEVGHALVAIDTTDHERVMVDVTPAIRSDTAKQIPMKVLAWVQVGDPYVRYPLEKLGSGFVNHRSTFLDRYKAETRFFESSRRMQDQQMSLTEEKKFLEDRVADLQNRIRQDSSDPALEVEAEMLKAQLEKFNSGILDFNSEAQELSRELKNRGYTSDSWVVSEVQVF
jgi:hypothetical protein